MTFKSDAFKDLTSLQERMNKIFTESLNRLREIGGGESGKNFVPPVDIFELPEAYLLSAEVPGIPREMISVEIVGGNLVIRGDKPKTEGLSEGSLYHSERRYGPFERTFNLPVNVTPESIKAHVADGVLTINIAKTGENASRIKVNID